MPLDLDDFRARLRDPARRDQAADELLATAAALDARAGRLDLAEAERLARDLAKEQTRTGAALRLLLAEYDRRGGTVAPVRVPATERRP